MGIKEVKVDDDAEDLGTGLRASSQLMLIEMAEARVCDDRLARDSDQMRYPMHHLLPFCGRLMVEMRV